MKKIALFTVAVVALMAVAAFAGGFTSGTVMTDANLVKQDKHALDPTKTITGTVTGTKPAFANTAVVTGTNALEVNCVNPTTGAASAARLKLNNTGTEIPINGVLATHLVPSTVTSYAFGKYSTGTVTDSVKCTAYGY